MLYPVVVYTNLFTLPGRDVKLNKYIDMYYVWLFNLFKYGSLRPTDYCVTFIDDVTFEYIKKSQIFKMISNQLPNFTVIKYKQPANIKGGIMKRYDIEEILELTYSARDPIYLYLDIDVLVMNDIHKLFKNQNKDRTTLYLRTEGVITNHLYYGDLMSEDDKQLLVNNHMELMPGFSAGIYGWHNSKDILDFFSYIKNLAAKTEKELYTVEQPFFNAAVFNYFFKKPIFNISLFNKDEVIDNTMIKPSETKIILVNFCGIPGDEVFHWDKILLQLFIQSL
jgi:hypothetical protein